MNTMSKYVRLVKTLKDSGILVDYNKVNDYIKDRNVDYYTSMFYYNEDQYKQFQEKGSVSGIKDVVTDNLIFDFDDAKNPDNARLDAIELIQRLRKYSIKPQSVSIYFSGKKGFTVTVKLPRMLAPERISKLAFKFAGDLKTLDTQIYNASRIIRVPFTRHQDTNLYKISLTYKDLTDKSVDEIKTLAIQNSLSIINPELMPATLDEKFFDVPDDAKKETKVIQDNTVEKPTNWKDCKWQILQGNFGHEPGERNSALMTLAATFKAQGYDKETAYYLCKSALKKQAALTGREEFPKEELWKNIIEVVYNDVWEGGQYTCKKEGSWLHKYCKSLGDLGCKDSLAQMDNVVPIHDTFKLFKDYAENIDSMTIKTGIESFDKKMRLTVGMSVGIVAPPGVGKTSIALQILNNMSKTGHRSLFFSYDMFHALVYQKLVQKHFQMSSSEIFKRFKERDEEFEKEVSDIIAQEYGNVDFCFNNGQKVEDIVATIKESERMSGKKVKLIIVDYNELVMTDYSDATASSMYVAQKLRQIANEMQICVISLYQPSKVSGSPADELVSYRSIKGSSAIEQSCSLILGMSRPGFDPKHPENDNYITINCLKNRMGPLFSVDLHWEGLTGSVRELTSNEKVSLRTLREEILKQKDKNNGSWE